MENPIIKTSGKAPYNWEYRDMRVVKIFRGKVKVILSDSEFIYEDTYHLEIRAGQPGFEDFNVDKNSGIITLPANEYTKLIQLAEAARNASKKAKSPQLPEITGVSEKQIAYAQRVRGDLLPQITESFQGDLDYFTSLGVSEGDYEAALNSVADARVWLDMLDDSWTDRGRNCLLLEKHLGREI